MATYLENIPVEKKALHVPQLQEIADVLNSGLKYNFEEVQAEVVDCPDLTQEPFTLARGGLTGKPRIVDVGGMPYLIPLAQEDKIYNFRHILKLAELESGFFLGAGAGPLKYAGTVAEGIFNVHLDKGSVDQHSLLAKINTKDNTPLLEKLPDTEITFTMIANLFLSEGKPGKVLKIYTKKRIGVDDFITSIRTTLATYYGDKIVGLGGTFLLKTGKGKLHVVPGYSPIPVNSKEDLYNWLNFYDMSAPLISIGTLVTGKNDLDLGLQHFHSFSHHGEAGHYHSDTTPETVEYLAYFNAGEYAYRIDKPDVTHSIGFH